MNVKRFTGRTAREAMQKVKLAFGDDAVVLSNKPCPEGVEIMAMSGEEVDAVDQFAEPAKVAAQQAIASAAASAQPRASQSSGKAAARQAQRPAARQAEPAFSAPREAEPQSEPEHTSVQDDVKKLAMSTLSFQDYVRERLLKRRQAALSNKHVEPSFDVEAARNEPPAQALAARLAQRVAQREGQPAPRAAAAQPSAPQAMPAPVQAAPVQAPMQAHVQPPMQAQMHAQMHAQMQPPAPAHMPAPAAWREPPVLREEVRLDDMSNPRGMPAQQPAWPVAGNTAYAGAPGATPVASAARAAAWGPAPTLADVPARAGTPEVGIEMMQELRNVKALVEERFSTIAFLETLQRSRGCAQLSQKLMDCGYSPGLVRKLVEAMPPQLVERVDAGKADTNDEMAWAAQVLEGNLLCADREPAIEDQGGVFALVGSTGVGKTTTTAKIAAVFAAKHGAANLGLITLDAYRIGAHEQLRAYGRILGVPVHTAHDRASLEDLLELLSSKKLVLIDTAGVAQRDTRCRELLDMLGHPRIRKLLVVNVAAQGETIEDVLVSYRANEAQGVVLSKLDEAVKLAPALDAVIRHKLKVVGVANGQRVPEDWHRLSARALVHRALRAGGSSAWRLDPSEVHLQFIKPAQLAAAGSAAAGAAM